MLPEAESGRARSESLEKKLATCGDRTLLRSTPPAWGEESVSVIAVSIRSRLTKSTIKLDPDIQQVNTRIRFYRGSAPGTVTPFPSGAGEVVRIGEALVPGALLG